MASADVDTTLHMITQDSPYCQITNYPVNDSLITLYHNKTKYDFLNKIFIFGTFYSQCK